MDSIRPQAVDANEARRVFTNTHDRLRKVRRKTDEEYVRILVDEVNRYFSSLDTSTLNTNDLPNKKEGPNSNKHNDLVNETVRDIDRIHGKQRNTEELLTKAVNYMSEERGGVGRAASKLQSRILSHKLRSSVNDRGMIIFTEYFNDEGLTDVQASKNFRIDRTRSALSLEPVSEDKDNSRLIDPSTIRLVVEVDKNEDQPDNLPVGFNSVYPLATQSVGEEFVMAYGRSLSREAIEFKDNNLTSATADNVTRVNKLQKQTLKDGYVIGEEDIEGLLGDVSHTEFEMIWNNFSPVSTEDSEDGSNKLKATNAIKESIADAGFSDSSVTINPSQILMDTQSGKSFGGANANVADSQNKPPDNIKEISLRFSLYDGVTLPGNLSRINIQFTKPSVGGVIPTIDYTESTIVTTEGESLVPFVNPPDSVRNKIEEGRSLMVSSTVSRPKEFSIKFKLDGNTSQYWDDVPGYIGAYWRFAVEGSDVVGYASTTVGSDSSGEAVRTNAKKVYYIYHDMVRAENVGKLPEVNLPVAKDVVSVNKGML